MIIPVKVNYNYQNYPFSPRATRLSRSVGILTAGVPCCLWGFFWAAIVNYIFDCCGMSENMSITLAMLSLPVYIFLIRKLKRKLNEKIQKIAMQDLMELQKTNPQEFMKYVKH